MAFPLVARLWPILSGFKETPSYGPYDSERLRILEIRLQFSDLKIKKKPAKIYMNVWIDHRRKLRTRTVDIGTESKLDWEEKFIFSVSENFFAGANAAISFEIYQARNILLRDSLVGYGVCHLNSLFNNQINDDEIEKEAVYDEEEDPRYENMYNESSEDSWREDEAEEEGMKASATVEVSNGGRWKGRLGFHAIVWKGFIAFVGASKCSLAMAYRDFMGLQPMKRTITREQFGCVLL